MKPQLAITGLTKLPQGYAGEPLSITLELRDKDGGIYEAGVDMDDGYNADNLRKCVTAFMRMMDARPVAVCVKSIKIKKL